MEPRTGKTKVAIDCAAALNQQGKVKRILVVCQLSGHPVWEDEFAKHCPVKYRLEALPRGSRAKIRALKRARRYNTPLLVVLINYESVWRIQPALLGFKPDMIICDEGHKLKNHRTRQSRAVHNLVRALDPYRLHLTGTPIAGKPLDVFSQYMVIDDSVFGRNWTKFRDRYAHFFGWYNRKVKFKNLPDLRRKARSRATVLTKEECLDLPPFAYDVVPVTMGLTTRRHYKEMKDDFVTFFRERDEKTSSAPIVLTQLMRLAQITGGFIKTDDGEQKQIGTEKLEALEDRLEELIEAGEKVVVFARFQPEVEAIERLCQRKKWKSWLYYGGHKGVRKKEAVRYPQAFQAHEGPAVFIASTGSGALSIDLSAACYVIFYSFDYSLINWLQCHDRPLAGQKRPVTYMYLLMRGTTDEDIYEVLHEKKEVSTLLNNRSKFLRKLLAS